MNNETKKSEQDRKNIILALKVLALALVSFFGFIIAAWMRSKGA